MYYDLLSAETHERISRIQREAAHYREMIDEAPLYFHTRNPLGDVRRFLTRVVRFATSDGRACSSHVR